MELKNQLKKYLLTDMSEDEAEEIDLKIISDENFVAELTHAEEDLMEEFLDEELSEAELGLFHKNFLVSDERKARLKQISLLRNYAQKESQEKFRELENPESKSIYDKIFKLFALNRQPALAVLSVFIVLLSGFIIWKVVFDKPSIEIASLEIQINELNKRDLKDLEDFKEIRNLSLFPGKTRSADVGNILSVEDLTENILIRLALPADLNEQGNYYVRIKSNQAEAISLDEVRVYENKSGRELRLLLPKSLLKKGECNIEVSAGKDDKYQLNYSFIVN